MVTLSQLIRVLQMAEAEHGGEILVKFPSNVFPDNPDTDAVNVEGGVTILNDDGSPAYLLVCDIFTLEAFGE